MHREGIELTAISKTFRTQRDDVRALRDIGFSCRSRGFTVLVGPSGCGKTTVLKLIGGLEEPTTGVITIDGMAPDEARRRRYFSYGFQNSVLLPWLKIVENVRLLPILANQRERTPAAELLRAVGLAGFEHRYPHELSGGMRQRASLARALSLKPRYLLLDEPFGALDDLTRESLDELLLDTWQRGDFGCVLITHNIGEAVYLADEIVVLSSRPAVVSAIIENPIERPRRPDIRHSARFQAIASQVREALA